MKKRSSIPIITAKIVLYASQKKLSVIQRLLTIFFIFFLGGSLHVNAQKIKRKVNNTQGNPVMIVFKESGAYKLDNPRKVFQEQLKISDDHTFSRTRSQSDKPGYVHERYQQYYRNLKVEFGTYTLHARSNKVASMSGEFYSIQNADIVPRLSKEQAFRKAIDHINAENYLWEYPEAARAMDNYQKPKGELLILPVLDQKTSTTKYKLAYKFDIYATNPLSRGYLYIDAHSGDALLYNAIIKHTSTFGHIGKVNGNTETYIRKTAKAKEEKTAIEAMVLGTAETRYSGTRTIETTQSGSFTLNDASRQVYTRDAQNQSTTGYPYVGNYIEFTDNNNNWTAVEHHNAAKDDAALDAHWGAMMTYDYWQSVHNRNSYDDNGAEIRSYVHVDNNYDNAFWNGAVMSYGDGSSNGNEGNGSFDALTSIDVVAHEIGHAVCTFTADLVYQRESGAMNEGFSDIWGAAVEHFAKGNGNDANPSDAVWLIADEIDRRAGSAALRSMSDPKLLGQPDTYGGDNWINPECGTPSSGNDYCGVHTNSGVLNYWFFLLVEGGSGTNDLGDSYSVSGIGMNAAADIAYRLESVYLSPNSTYADARTFGIQAAIDLFGACSQQVISTTNAWFAVGIGDEYSFEPEILNLYVITIPFPFPPIVINPFSGTDIYESDIINVGDLYGTGNITASNGSDITLVASTEINLLPGTHILSGSEFVAYIEPSNCANPIESVLPAEGQTGGQNPSVEANLQITHEKPAVKIYPNPASDQLYIALPDERKLASVNVYNLQGRQVATAKSTTVSVTHLAAGMYFVQVQLTNGERITKKIIVSKD